MIENTEIRERIKELSENKQINIDEWWTKNLIIEKNVMKIREFRRIFDKRITFINKFINLL